MKSKNECLSFGLRHGSLDAPYQEDLSVRYRADSNHRSSYACVASCPFTGLSVPGARLSGLSLLMGFPRPVHPFAVPGGFEPPLIGLLLASCPFTGLSVPGARLSGLSSVGLVVGQFPSFQIRAGPEGNAPSFIHYLCLLLYFTDFWSLVENSLFS